MPQRILRQPAIRQNNHLLPRLYVSARLLRRRPRPEHPDRRQSANMGRVRKNRPGIAHLLLRGLLRPVPARSGPSASTINETPFAFGWIPSDCMYWRAAAGITVRSVRPGKEAFGVERTETPGPDSGYIVHRNAVYNRHHSCPVPAFQSTEPQHSGRISGAQTIASRLARDTSGSIPRSRVVAAQRHDQPVHIRRQGPIHTCGPPGSGIPGHAGVDQLNIRALIRSASVATVGRTHPAPASP